MSRFLGDSNQLDLEGGLYVGGLSPSLSPPPTLWSAVLSQGFVGCIRDLVLNGKAVDIAQFARAQDSSKNINIFDLKIFWFDFFKFFSMNGMVI